MPAPNCHGNRMYSGRRTGRENPPIPSSPPPLASRSRPRQNGQGPRAPNHTARPVGPTARPLINCARAPLVTCVSIGPETLRCRPGDHPSPPLLVRPCEPSPDGEAGGLRPAGRRSHGGKSPLSRPQEKSSSLRGKGWRPHSIDCCVVRPVIRLVFDRSFKINPASLLARQSTSVRPVT